MRRRGLEYWKWSDCALPNRFQAEDLANGSKIDVVVRLSRTGVIQMFLGVYLYDGSMVYEEYRDSIPSITMDQAMSLGLERARALGEEKANYQVIT